MCADDIDFGEYARALVQDLFLSFSERAALLNARFDTCSVRLNVDQAIPCGLILNELVTNALKYAYPRGEIGEILVTLAESPEGIVSLSVADNGRGLPDGFNWNNSKSMGMPIADMLAQQIGGQLTFRTRPGTTFTVAFPRQVN